MASKLLVFFDLHGAPGEIRTPGLLIRSQSLYPAELRAHTVSLAGPKTDYQGMDGGAIRLRVPVVVPAGGSEKVLR
jgi:hypothetical protein